MKKERVEWIDIVKGIGIITVVMVHSGISYEIIKFLLSFNMQLFFFISGYLFKSEAGVLAFIKKKGRSLLIPYFSFSIITYLFWLIVEQRIRDSSISSFKPLLGIFYSNNIDNFMVFNGVLWFLTCLFVVECLYCIIVKKIKDRKKIVVLLVVMSIIGYLDSLFTTIRLPWSINIALTAIVFYGIGNVMKSYINRLTLYKRSKLLLAAGLSFLLALLVNRYNSIIYMYDNSYGNYVLFYLASLLGILGVACLSMAIKKSKVLSYLGINSLIILAVHGKIFLVFNFIMNIFGTSNRSDMNELIKGITYTVFALLICIPVIYIINRYFPFLLGRRINIRKN